MITFKTIKYKNFLSTGNNWTEIDFEKNNTNLIIGTNGAGKSTMLDALTFVLFNKPFRKINKPQLANSTNERDCLVEIEFEINTRQYIVRRGIKPNVFDIVVNGTELHREADDRAMQRVLEDNILKVNYKSFTQIVILGSSTFIPFMQLSASHRREVIEDLLDIKIFSSMNTTVKEKIRSVREEMRTLDLKKESLKDKVDMQKNFIHQIEESGQKNIDTKKKKITTILEEIESLNADIEKVSLIFNQKQEEMKNFVDASKKVRKLASLKAKIEQKKENCNKENRFFNENTVCPTCTQPIEEQFRLNRIEDLNTSIKKFGEGLSELEDKINEEEQRELQFLNLSNEVSKLTNGISQSNVRISGLRKQSQDLESEIQGITDKLKNRGSEHEKLELYNEQLNKVFDNLSERREEIEYYDYVYSLLRDGGVKTNIVKKYLPLINQSVNKYLHMMDFYINLQLDEEFGEQIQSPIHEDFTYSSFSEGEKQRIDLALLFAWREVAKVKNSVNTNIMIFDEVFDSSLDGVGTDDFLKIIRFVIKDANIFVISHKSEISEKFETVIKFEKIKGFSSITTS